MVYLDMSDNFSSVALVTFYLIITRFSMKRHFELVADNGLIVRGHKTSLGILDYLEVEIPTEIIYGNNLLVEALYQRLSLKSLSLLAGRCPGMQVPIKQGGKTLGVVSPLIIEHVRARKETATVSKPDITRLPHGQQINISQLKRLARKHDVKVRIEVCPRYPEVLTITYQGSYVAPIEFCNALGLWHKEDIGTIYVHTVVGVAPERVIDL